MGLFLTPDAPAYAIAVRGLPLFAAGLSLFRNQPSSRSAYYPEHRARTLATGSPCFGHRADGFTASSVLPRLAAVAGSGSRLPAAELAVTLLLLVLLRIGYGMRR